MPTPLRILIVEDSEDDADLVALQIKRGGYQPVTRRVDTAPAMRDALYSEHWEIVIADFSMPRFSGLAALRVLREIAPNLPLILVSGTIGEEVAVQAMKAGASDYIMKDNLTRLVPAIERELREAEHRRLRRTAEDSLYRERERAMVTLHSIGDGVITTDATGHIEYINPVAEKLLGWSLGEAAGLPLMDVFSVLNEATRKPIRNPAEVCLSTGCVVSLDQQSLLVSRDGREFAIEDSAAPIRDREGKLLGTVLVFHDVTDERRLARDIDWQSTHDSLTGLENRCEFEKHLSTAVKQCGDSDCQSLLIYLDVDQFKVVNDTCGHIAGDELLKQLTAGLQAVLPDDTVLARLGGDEFGVLIKDCGLPQGEEYANQLLDVARQFRFHWDDSDFEVFFSAGLVLLDEKILDSSAALSAADVACYVAKDMGRNRLHVYRTQDIELARRHSEMQWVSKIHQALEENRLVLYRQPIEQLQGKADHKRNELLVRIRDRNGTLIAPGAFIPAAERYNLMPAIDRWVITTVFEYYRHIMSTTGDWGDIVCSINLSGNSLNDQNMLGFIKKQMEDNFVTPQMICFEITETAAIANLARASQFIRDLRAIGCSFALDDFGSGLSSFAYLKNLPVDYLKIDGNFVRDVVTSPIDRAMVESINHIGHVMGMQTIAEFVEDDAILDVIRNLGVDFAQGFGIAAPSPFLPEQQEPLEAMHSPP